MSGIVLSSSVRQNLLSLQSTADLLATTQNRLATGKKVNTALDNPTNYFTAASLDTAPATSTICSTASATACRCCRPPTPASPRCRSWSTAPSRSPTRRCRATVGYSAKSSVCVTITGATATNLRGTTTYTSATASSSVLYSGAAGGTTAAVSARSWCRGRDFNRLRTSTRRQRRTRCSTARQRAGDAML